MSKQRYRTALPLCLTSLAWFTAAWANTPPEADFDVADIRGLNVSLFNTSSDADGDKLSYKWYFGDNATSKVKSPEHTYAADGTYKITLKVSDGTTTVKKVQTVTVSNNAPVVSFDVAENYNRRVTLVSTSYDPDGDKLACKWNLGDGTTSKGCTVNHEYAADGTYKIVLKVSDGHKSAKAAKKVKVAGANQPPVASFDVIENAGLKIRILNLSSDPDGDALAYKWYFGDGSTSKEKDPEHTYAQPGVYQVTLKASDGNKTVKSVQNVSVIVNQPPVADFEVAEKSGRKVTLVNNSSDPDGDALKYKWYFGDGSTSKEMNPVHTYAENGTYSVVLKVSDGQVTKSKKMKISVGGEGGATVEWVSATGQVNHDLVIVFPQMNDACRVDQGTVIVSDGSYGLAEYHAYVWNEDSLTPAVAWPGTDITNAVVAGCDRTTRQYSPSDPASGKTLSDYNMIIINDGNGRQTADIAGLSQQNPCVILSENNGQLAGETVTAAECGVHVNGMDDAEVPNEVYIYRGDHKFVDGDEIKITETAGAPGTGSAEITVLIKGINAGTGARGYYWIDNDELNKAEFINGDVLRIGENISVTDGETKDAVLHLQYVETDESGLISRITESSFIIIKTYSDENADVRMIRPSETLGATYTADRTTFRLWSPDSSDVKVTVNGRDYEMKPVAMRGYEKVYGVTVEGDLAGKTYQFTVAGNKVRDPYGRMVAKGSDTANVIMDLSQTDPDEGWTASPELKNREDTIVYEVHVRDFTIDPTSGVDADKRGRYLGMVQTGTTVNDEGLVKTGIDHLKELGVTHVQLMPVYDYATCSTVDSQNNSCYNWGYDPLNYNVPEDRYSSVFGTDRYAQKIREFKTMINEFHKNGIRVIMDVVYNHTYDKSVFEKITDKYYLGKNDLSGCGNAINADNNMVWMMIRDSLDYWVTEYHIDGFRFDLAGVFSLKDFGDWGKYLNMHHPKANLVIYGEPWVGGGDPSAINEPVRTGRMWTQDPDAHVGAFNNRVRNCLKGASDSSDSTSNMSKLGFIFDKLNTGWDGNGTDENGWAISNNKDCVYLSVRAGVRTRNAPPYVVDEWSAQGYSDPEQSVTYITAHDNLALRDKIERASLDGTVLYNERDVRAIQAYANSIIMISQGIAFIHGGEEIGRTKKAAGESGDSPMWNTYKTTTGANDFKWDLKAGEWGDVSDTYAAYIRMRREHPAFHMTTADLINDNVSLDPASGESVVIININGAAVGDTWGTIKVVMNSSDREVAVNGVGSMTKVADGTRVGDDVVNNAVAAARSVSIWVTENAGGEICSVPQRYASLYLVGSFEDSAWGRFVELERKCDKNFAWWQTKEPVSLDNSSEFLLIEEAGNWSSRKIGYESANVTSAFCTGGGSGSITTDCSVFTLTEGAGTGNIVPGSWSGANLAETYDVQLFENDLSLNVTRSRNK